MSTVFRKLKALDAFPKVQDDFHSKTLSGGVITIVCCTIMGCLFLSELGSFMLMQKVHKLEVDTSRGETITMKIDMILPRLPCEWMSIVALDVSGRVQTNVDHDLSRERLNLRGVALSEAEKHHVGTEASELPIHLHPDTSPLPEGYCGSCYGAEAAEGQCCNTCEEVRQAYRVKGWVMPDYVSVEQCQREGFQDDLLSVKNEGCHVWGDVHVAKVAGRIQLVPGKAYEAGGRLIQDMQPLRNQKIDISHEVKALSFGAAYPGQVNPLHGAKFDQRKSSKENPSQSTGTYQYFLKVVPTSYTSLRNQTTQSSQYSVTEHYKPLTMESMLNSGSAPGVLFNYDLSAIKVNVIEARTSFLHFLTNVCAIVGGVFTVSGILDSTLYHGQKLIRKKMELGKYG